MFCLPIDVSPIDVSRWIDDSNKGKNCWSQPVPDTEGLNVADVFRILRHSVVLGNSLSQGDLADKFPMANLGPLKEIGNNTM